MAVSTCNGDKKAPKDTHAFAWTASLRRWKCSTCGRTTARLT